MATPSWELAEAVETLLQVDPARIATLVSSLRAPDRFIESTVHGISMGNVIPSGARIRIELIQRPRYDSGEVVAYLAGNQVVVHRVLHRGRFGPGRGLVLAGGDVPVVPDAPVKHSMILGPVTAIYQDGCWGRSIGVSKRSFRARVASSLVLATAIFLLYVSPRATAVCLTWLHRLERAIRCARAQDLRQRAPAPPSAP